MTGVQVRSVSFGYRRRRVLEDVSLDIASGVHVLLGRNGAGKTTLLRIIAGLLSPTTGSIGHLSGDSTRLRVGYLPQASRSTGLLTVGGLVEHVAWLHRIPAQERANAVTAALAALDLEALRGDSLARVSGGEARRAYIAQAIVHRPDVVLLDEPSAGLDPLQRARLREVIRTIAQDVPVLLSTHLVEDVVRLADRVTVLDDRRVAYTGGLAGLVGDADATDSVRVEEAILRRFGAGEAT